MGGTPHLQVGQRLASNIKSPFPTLSAAPGALNAGVRLGRWGRARVPRPPGPPGGRERGICRPSRTCTTAGIQNLPMADRDSCMGIGDYPTGEPICWPCEIPPKPPGCRIAHTFSSRGLIQGAHPRGSSKGLIQGALGPANPRAFIRPELSSESPSNPARGWFGRSSLGRRCDGPVRHLTPCRHLTRPRHLTRSRDPTPSTDSPPALHPPPPTSINSPRRPDAALEGTGSSPGFETRPRHAPRFHPNGRRDR